jgi:microcystin-dependent protein
MNTPYPGEIRMFASNFAPLGWAFCNGQLLPIDDAPDLFDVIHTTYGGDGETTFGLPDLRSRVPIHFSADHPAGSSGGEESVAIVLEEQLPLHKHLVEASALPATSSDPTGNLLAEPGWNLYHEFGTGPGAMAPLNPKVLDLAGGGEPHPNMQPFQVLNFIVSTGSGEGRWMIAEVRMFASDQIPTGWFACDGSLYAISGYSALFALIGPAFGGDSRTTFAVPDLRGAVVVGAGQGDGLTPRNLGETGGTDTVALLESQLPPHNHTLYGYSDAADTNNPSDMLVAGASAYSPFAGALAATSSQSVTQAGVGLPHNNLQPYVTLSFAIAHDGIFPQRP